MFVIHRNTHELDTLIAEAIRSDGLNKERYIEYRSGYLHSTNYSSEKGIIRSVFRRYTIGALNQVHQEILN